MSLSLLLISTHTQLIPTERFFFAVLDRLTTTAGIIFYFHFVCMNSVYDALIQSLEYLYQSKIF